MNKLLSLTIVGMFAVSCTAAGSSGYDGYGCDDVPLYVAPPASVSAPILAAEEQASVDAHAAGDAILASMDRNAARDKADSDAALKVEIAKDLRERDARERRYGRADAAPTVHVTSHAHVVSRTNADGTQDTTVQIDSTARTD